jgi:hypothetical protein
MLAGGAPDRRRWRRYNAGSNNAIVNNDIRNGGAPIRPSLGSGPGDQTNGAFRVSFQNVNAM